jgi:hypothetical protein
VCGVVSARRACVCEEGLCILFLILLVLVLVLVLVQNTISRVAVERVCVPGFGCSVDV